MIIKADLKYFFIAVLFFTGLLSTGTASAQTDIGFISSKLQLAYKSPAYLSFDVKYTYALESDSTTILDSSFGTFKISGQYYWGKLDSTEYMQNSSYAIMLYKSEKLMRVSNPTTIYPEIANFSSIDSIIGKNNYTNSFSTSGRNKFITMSFASSDYPYKKFRVAYDSSTNFVTQISYTIREDFTDYKDSYSRSASGNTSDYVIVKAIYSNYQTSAFSNTVFSSGNYFLLSGSTYVAQPPYSDYEVFIASPNLIK